MSIAESDNSDSSSAGKPVIRIGDDERTAATDSLAEHYSAGRLNGTEFEERTAAAWAAQTIRELQPLFADLPQDSIDKSLAEQLNRGTSASENAPAIYAEGQFAIAEPESEGEGLGSKLLEILTYTFPLFALMLFTVLHSLGVEEAWLIFLTIPVFYIALSVFDDGEDEDDDEETEK